MNSPARWMLSVATHPGRRAGLQPRRLGTEGLKRPLGPEASSLQGLKPRPSRARPNRFSASLRPGPLGVLEVPPAPQRFVKLDDYDAAVQFRLGKIALGGKQQ